MNGNQSTRYGLTALALLGCFAWAGCDTQVGVGAEGRGPTKAPLTEMGLIDDHEEPTAMDELGDPILLPSARPAAEEPAGAAAADTAAAAAPAARDTAAAPAPDQ